MRKTLSEDMLIFNEIRRLLIPFKNRNNVTINIKKTIVPKTYVIIVTDGTISRMSEELHLEGVPYKLCRTKNFKLQLESFGFTKIEKGGKYSPYLVIISS